MIMKNKYIIAGAVLSTLWAGAALTYAASWDITSSKVTHMRSQKVEQNLTAEQKEAMQAKQEQFKQEFEAKKEEMQKEFEANKQKQASYDAVIDALLAGNTLTTEQKALVPKIQAQRAEAKERQTQMQERFGKMEEKPSKDGFQRWGGFHFQNDMGKTWGNPSFKKSKTQTGATQ